VRCPYCNFRFKLLAVNSDQLPDLAPIVCESCARVGLLDHGVPRRLSDAELAEVKRSPAWGEFIAPALELLEQERRKRS
jgi:uncharacterized protein YbaR (Trm112 family)